MREPRVAKLPTERTNDMRTEQHKAQEESRPFGFPAADFLLLDGAAVLVAACAAACSDVFFCEFDFTDEGAFDGLLKSLRSTG